MASKELRFRAMTRALPTGLAAFVTFPRTCRTVGSGGTSGFAGFATAIKVNATANRRTRRINLLKPTPAQPRIVLLVALSATHRSVTGEPQFILSGGGGRAGAKDQSLAQQ